MLEKVGVGGEKNAEGAGATDRFEGLTEIEFDSNKARSLAKRDEPEEAEKIEKEGGNSDYSAMTLEKKEEELSPQEAANEYLSLLDELSQDFSNPYYSDERKGRHHYAGSITKELGLKYSDNPHYRWSGYAGTEAGETDGTMLRIASADNIIANEIGWRIEGEKVGEWIKQIDKKIAELNDEYSKKSELAKFYWKKKYEQRKKELEGFKGDAERLFNRQYNDKIAKELAIAYDTEDYYDGRGLWRDKNEARNRQFFGFDDSERAKKVERAIELRQKYEAEWSKKH